jgi:hypothetical protein
MKAVATCSISGAAKLSGLPPESVLFPVRLPVQRGGFFTISMKGRKCKPLFLLVTIAKRGRGKVEVTSGK